MTRLFDLWRRATTAAVDGTPDGELLTRFVRHQDEAAFTELVDRHGPLVYGACRRLLPDPFDAEDAFQAAFLVLVRRAAQVTDRPLGPWLHQVAVWTARNLRRRNAVRLAVSGPLGGPGALPASPDTPAADARLDVDAALARLPQKYRVPLILCHLQGWTRQDAASHLGCPESTLSSHLSRGLAQLRKRLGRDPAVVLAVAGSVAAPTTLTATAVRAAVLLRTGSLSAAARPAVADLTHGVLRMFWIKKVAFAGVVLVAAAMIGLGSWAGTDPGSRAAAQPPAAAGPKSGSDQIDKEIEELRIRIRLLEATRQWQKAAEELEKANAAAGVLELTVGAGPPALELVEFDRPGGKVLLRVWPANADALKQFLTRARKDPVGPRRLTVRVEPSYPADKTKELVGACRTAGYEPRMEVRLKSQLAAPKWSAAFTDLRPLGVPTVARPPYVIEPPDNLLIEAVVQEEVEDLDGNGQPKLGPDKKPIRRRVARPLPVQPITGAFQVRPDGTVGLGFWGSVSVSGLTMFGTADAVRTHLLKSPGLQNVRPENLSVAVDVLAYNSKAYYVIVSGPDGDQITRFRITGSDTILDAMANVSVLPATADKADIALVRQGRAGQPDERLPVDWKAITGAGNVATNYQLLPGDRIHVRTKK